MTVAVVSGSDIVHHWRKLKLISATGFSNILAVCSGDVRSKWNECDSVVHHGLDLLLASPGFRCQGEFQIS